MVKYIVIDSGSAASQLMFRDIKKLKCAMETSELFKFNNPILRILNKVHMSGKINRIFDIPFKGIWDKFYVMEEAKSYPQTDYIIVFTNISVKKIRLGYLRKIGSLSNVHLILVSVDSFVDKKLSPLDIMDKIPFEIVYSFDPNDCEQYDLEYTNSLYSRRLDISASNEQTDLFFIGRAKDRLKDILSIAKRAVDNGMKINFQILGVKKEDQVQFPGITYLKKVKPYDEVLPLIMASKCLLDLYQAGQYGLTMRAYEAVFYNKMLITNNDYIKKLAYYKPQCMYVFNSIDEIDFTFIRQNKDVDYEYEDEYSPIYFLGEIEKKLRERGKLL